MYFYPFFSKLVRVVSQQDCVVLLWVILTSPLMPMPNPKDEGNTRHRRCFLIIFTAAKPERSITNLMFVIRILIYQSFHNLSLTCMVMPHAKRVNSGLIVVFKTIITQNHVSLKAPPSTFRGLLRANGPLKLLSKLNIMCN